MIKKILCIASFSFLLFSCSSDDDSQTTTNETDFSEGIIIVNEGNFGTSNASISAINSNSVSNLIFKNANGRSVGDVAQSITFNDAYAFVVVNNSNVIEVVNKTNFRSVATITEQMSSPRYAVIENNKLFVTHMYANKVTVYNATTFEYLETITLSFQPELIVEENDKIYVSSNFYAATNKIAVINPTSNIVETELNFANAINGLTTGNDKVYALTTNDASTTIHEISNTAISNEISLPMTNSRYIEFDSNKLYFTSNLNVYELAPTATSATLLFSVTDNSWSSLYGFEVFDGKIYTSDAKAFTEDGVVTIYNTSGSVLNTFRVGVGPNGFYKD